MGYHESDTFHQPEQERLPSQRIVIKIGSSTITTPEGIPDVEFMNSISEQIIELKKRGFQIAIVSSGAVASGRSHVPGYDPTLLEHRRMAAAIGQALLIHTWSSVLKQNSDSNLEVAQFLLTDPDIARGCDLLSDMMNFEHIVPIINANDVVSDYEMRQWMKYSADNDVLAGEVASHINAQHVVILSQSGVLIDGQTVQWIDPQYPPEIEFGGRTSIGTGGMESKHTVAMNLAQKGISVFIANGRAPHILLDYFNGEPAGTLYEQIQ